MSIRRLFYTDFKETRRIYQKEFETNVEATLEEERVDGYAEFALEYGERLARCPVSERENLRIRSLNDLDKKRNEIVELINVFIDRSAWFVVMFDAIIRISIIATILTAIFSCYNVAIVLLVFILILHLISQFGAVFAGVSFFLTGSGALFEELLGKYHSYGCSEAALFFSDYRNLSKAGEKQKIWVYTTSHKTAP